MTKITLIRYKNGFNRPRKNARKSQNTQWTLSDIDWDAPGRERITAEQCLPKLKDFMADLMWIEHVGARIFRNVKKSTHRNTP